MVVTVAGGATTLTGGGCLQSGNDGVPRDCPPPEEVRGDCAQPGLACSTGRLTGCGDVDLIAVCEDDRWVASETSCNPPPVVVDARAPDVVVGDSFDACPPPAEVDGPCEEPKQGLECLTGRTTDCGYAEAAICDGKSWRVLVDTCNPPFVEDAGQPDCGGDGVPSDAGQDAARGSAGPFGDGVPFCPTGTTLPEAGADCDEATDCHLGGCVVDWHARITCVEGQWKLRPFNCWTGQWVDDDAKDDEADAGG